jgi:hypothetical protein
MNTSAFVGAPPFRLIRLRWGIVLVLAVGGLNGIAQTKKPIGPTQGYLSKDTPPALRFSPPPRPPVANLPPSAIATDVPPVFSDTFLEKNQPPIDDSSRPKLPAKPLRNSSKASNEKAKPGTVQANPNVLKMLVRYFEHGSPIPGPSAEAIHFQPPLKEETTTTGSPAPKEPIGK